MPEEKKYYWLKLKRDFFKRHDITVIESLPNGDKYLLFYMKLLVESIDHEGALRFSDTVPYDDLMLSAITHTDIDIVRSAVKVFRQFSMMDIMDDGTLYLNQVETMIGDETAWAEKKRLYRERQKLIGTTEGQKGTMSDKSIELEKELEKDIEIETPEPSKKTPKKETCINTESDFATFYNVYPKKVDKTDARKVFDSLIKKGVTLDTILSRLKTYQKTLTAERTEPKYIRGPARFLRTLDDFEEAKPAAPAVPRLHLCKCGSALQHGTCLSCGAIYGPDGKEVAL